MTKLIYLSTASGVNSDDAIYIARTGAADSGDYQTPWSALKADTYTPASDDVSDLGSSTFRFQDLYLSGNIQLEDGKSIRDGDGNELIVFQASAGATNYIEIYNGSAGVSIRTAGVSSDVALNLRPKGSGDVIVDAPTLRPIADVTTDLGSSSRKFNSLHLGEGVLFSEMSAPTGVADKAILYADVSGAKTRLMVVFQDDVPQQLAIEP